MTDTDYLRRAFDLSQQSSEPVKCGCVIVLNGEMIAESYNSQRTDENAVHHAEIKAIVAANQKIGSRKLRSATAYCSCEPCVMCLAALSLANVERIVYGQTMAEVAANDPMATLDSAAFAKEFLNFVPKIERHLV